MLARILARIGQSTPRNFHCRLHIVQVMRRLIAVARRVIGLCFAERLCRLLQRKLRAMLQIRFAS